MCTGPGRRRALLEPAWLGQGLEHIRGRLGSIQQQPRPEWTIPAFGCGDLCLDGGLALLFALLFALSEGVIV